MENQICTNKEQSSRLLEAGMSPETADCYLHRIVETNDWSSENVQELIIEPWMSKPGLLDMSDHYPAWSLSNLINILPPFVEERGTLYIVAGLHTERYNLNNKTRDHKYGVEYGVSSITSRYENPFDALIEAIEWLIKEGYFDKRYLVEKGDRNGRD